MLPTPFCFSALQKLVVRFDRIHDAAAHRVRATGAVQRVRGRMQFVRVQMLLDNIGLGLEQQRLVIQRRTPLEVLQKQSNM